MDIIIIIIIIKNWRDWTQDMGIATKKILKSETESLLTAAKNDIRTKYVKAIIDDAQKKSKWGLCRKKMKLLITQ